MASRQISQERVSSLAADIAKRAVVNKTRRRTVSFAKMGTSVNQRSPRTVSWSTVCYLSRKQCRNRTSGRRIMARRSQL
jgi:hypothetical protein